MPTLKTTRVCLLERPGIALPGEVSLLTNLNLNCGVTDILSSLTEIPFRGQFNGFHGSMTILHRFHGLDDIFR